MRIGLNAAFWSQETTGSGQYIRQLAPALAELAPEHEYALLAPRYAGGLAAVAAPGWRLYALGTPFDALHRNLAKLWFEQVTFPRACGRQRIDLAHVPYFAPPLRCPCPTVVTIHDLIPLILPGYRGSPWVRAYTRLVASAARRADLVITDSRASAADIVRLLGIPAARVRTIYLAVGPAYRPLSVEERRPTLVRLGLPARYLLYLGGFDRRKNVAGLLRAYERARPELDALPLVIAGRLPREDSAFAPDPRPIARRLGLDDLVHYTGWVAEEDKPALYAGALALLFPSSYEGFGLPVLEALSCGRPAIVGAGSALEEVAGPGGLAIPPTDVDALASAIVNIAQDAALREALSRKGLAHARGFSWRETARATLAAYAEALAGA